MRLKSKKQRESAARRMKRQAAKKNTIRQATLFRQWPEFKQEPRANVRLVPKYRPTPDVEDIIAMQQAETARLRSVLRRQFRM